MKNIFRNTAILIICLIFSSSKMNAQVTYDYDKEADFTTYKTYNFGGWQKDSDKLINDIDKKRIYDSFKSEFTQREMDYVLGDDDVVVTFFVVIDEKTSTTAATPAVISTSALTDDAEITIDIDTIGSTVAGAGLKITLKGTRA